MKQPLDAPYVTNPGAHLSLDGENIAVRRGEETPFINPTASTPMAAPVAASHLTRMPAGKEAP